MGSSFIKFRGHGFWSRDSFIEDFAREVAVAVDGLPKKEDWLAELAAHWQLQASGIFGGWIHLKLDDFLVSEERRKEARGIFRAITDRHAPAEPIHQTGALMLQLLDGELTTDAASPLDYMVGKEPNQSPERNGHSRGLRR